MDGNQRNKRHGNKICYIEKLPEDPLIKIISLLPVRDAVATSSISRSWKSLWTKSLFVNLHFNAASIIGFRYPDRDVEREVDRFYGRNVGDYGRVLPDEIVKQIVEDFVSRVDKVVGCRHDQKVGAKELEVKFPLQGQHSSHLDSWILSTVTPATERLVLVLGTTPDRSQLFEESELYRFPFELLLSRGKLSLEFLQLEFVWAKLPESFDGFSRLKTLKLCFTDVAQGDVEKLLISCPLLEYVCLEYCLNLFAVEVSAPLPRLRTFIVEKCLNLKKIKLTAENLSGFQYSGAVTDERLLLKSCRILTKAALIDDYIRYLYFYRYELSNDFPYVKELYLGSSAWELNAILLRCKFARLKFLALYLPVFTGYEHTLNRFPTSLNAAAPMLEELEFHLDLFTDGKTKYEKIDDEPYKYNHLTRVAFTGFRGERYQVELAKYFLKNTKKLQVMTIDPLCKVYKNFGSVPKCKATPTPSEIGSCRMAYELLCRKAPKKVKLILVDNLL